MVVPEDGFGHNLSLDGSLLIIAEGVFREAANGLSIEVEGIGNSAASQSNEGKERAGPLEAQTFVHLLGEQDGAGTPHGTDEGLGCEGRCCLVLVGID
jgi:hypothetical protein